MKSSDLLVIAVKSDVSAKIEAVDVFWKMKTKRNPLIVLKYFCLFNYYRNLFFRSDF